MTTRRERVLQALNFETPDRVPKDLGGMMSTGISCFAYPKLVEALGLPYRPTRICDTGQMLALPDLDVLDALDCDVCPVLMEVTNAFPQPEKWHPYDFNGRLDALVQDPDVFELRENGVIAHLENNSIMPPESHVFETEHGGHPLLLTGDVPKPDLDALREKGEANRFTEEKIAEVAAMCKQARESTDRAILFNGPGAGIGIANFGGIAVFPLLCLTEPEYVKGLHDAVIDYTISEMSRILEAVHPYIDIYQCCSDDWGTQNQLIASKDTFDSLFKPYYKQFTERMHTIAPDVKCFLHSCGAIYDLLDSIVDCGFDVLNPVQWMAGGHSYREWKDTCRDRIALWGGGVNAQHTLPMGSVAEVEKEVSEIVPCLAEGGGYVFNAVHNLLAEVAPEKVIAMYATASKC